MRSMISAAIAAVVLIAHGSSALRADEPADLAALRDAYRRPPATEPAASTLVRLGEKIFFDAALAQDGVRSCAACHDPAQGWEDGRALAQGRDGMTLSRHTPTVIDSFAQTIFRWDGTASSLADASLRPFFDPNEMALADDDELIARMAREASYRAAFRAAFGDDEIDRDRVGRALAAFQGTIRSGDSPFDRWVDGEEDHGMDAGALRGFALFNGKARCAKCHSGWRFTEDAFHDIGLVTEDRGRGAQIPVPFLQHAFKTPTLRDIERRAPYMHNGSLATLIEVVRHYENGFVMRESLSSDMESFKLSDAERADLVAFLRSLTSGPASEVGRRAAETEG